MFNSRSQKIVKIRIKLEEKSYFIFYVRKKKLMERKENKLNSEMKGLNGCREKSVVKNLKRKDNSQKSLNVTAACSEIFFLLNFHCCHFFKDNWDMFLNGRHVARGRLQYLTQIFPQFVRYTPTLGYLELETGPLLHP